MAFDELPVHRDVGAGRAKVRRGALSGAWAAEELDFDRGREVLSLFLA